MLKRLIFSLFLYSVVSSACGMHIQQSFGDGSGAVFDDTVEVNFRDEVYGFQNGHLLTKPLEDVDEDLAEQICSSQQEVVGSFMGKLHNFTRLDKPVTRVLFTGGPGCGKSTLARYIPQKYDWNCYFLKSSLIETEFKASGNQNLNLLFNSILNTLFPMVLIMDEINSITDKLKRPNDTDAGMASTLWTFLDDCVSNKNILFIATTNDYDGLPETLKTRFTGGVCNFKDPSFGERKDIIKFHLDQHNGLSLPALSILAFCWEGQSARDIKGFIIDVASDKQSKHLDLYPDQSKDDFLVTFDDIYRKGLQFKWPRCSKLKSTLYEYPGTTAFVATSLVGLGMYWLNHKHSLEMHQEQMAENASARLEARIERGNDRVVSGLVEAAQGKPLPLIMEAVRSDSHLVPMAAEMVGVKDPKLIGDTKDMLRHAVIYQTIAHGLPWVVGGPVAPAIIWSVYGIYGLTYAYNVSSE